MENSENKPSIIKPKTADLVVPEVFNISNHDYNKALLKAQLDEDLKHVITDINDKAGEKKAIELRAKYRTIRTDIEKWRKSKVKPINEFLTKLKKATDDLGNQSLAGEEFFDNQLKCIAEERIRIAEEERLSKQRVLSYRIAAISAIGATFDGERYSYQYTTTNVITGAELNDFTDDDFQQYLAFAMGDWDEEQLRLENKRIADEQAETERLATIEATKIQAQANQAKQKSLRLKELSLMGGIQENEHYIVKGSTIPLSTIVEANDEEWDELIRVIELVEINNTEPLKSEILAKREQIVEPRVNTILTRDECIEAFNNAGLVFKEVIPEEIDYSLNDFENLTKGCYNGTEKEKQIILEAIASYKQGMDNF